jgi:hypothetical protein
MVIQARSGGLRSPGAVDRALVAASVVVWLAVIGVGVAAIVALVDKGSGRDGGTTSGSQTPWLLYVVIGVSAVVILGAVPLLLRARQSGQAAPTRGQVFAAPRPTARNPLGGKASGHPVGEAQTEKLRVFGSVAEPIDRDLLAYRSPRPRRLPGGLTTQVLDRLWLRGTASIVGAMGLAMLAVATATYLMAVDEDNPAWTALGVAGIVTVLMPGIPWFYLRQLRANIGGAR